MGLNQREKKNYVSILGSDGTLRKVVPEGTEGAVRRDYETPKGEKGTKYELVYDTVDGKITDVHFSDSEYGQRIEIEVDGGDVVITTNTSNNFATDFMAKLPNVDLSQSITINPYSFTGDNGKPVRGMSLVQNGEKIQSYFYDGSKNINGMPDPEGDTKKFDSDDWKVYFLSVKKFLINYTEENIKFEKVEATEEADF